MLNERNNMCARVLRLVYSNPPSSVISLRRKNPLVNTHVIANITYVLLLKKMAYYTRRNRSLSSSSRVRVRLDEATAARAGNLARRWCAGCKKVSRRWAKTSYLPWTVPKRIAANDNADEIAGRVQIRLPEICDPKCFAPVSPCFFSSEGNS